MNYTLRNVGVDELHFKMNNVRIEPNTKIQMMPQFVSHVQSLPDNAKIKSVILEAKLASTEKEPKPFNFFVRVVGVFECQDVSSSDMDRFVQETVPLLYPYLRTAVVNLTATSYQYPSLMLPVTFPGQPIKRNNGGNWGISFGNTDILN